MFCYGMYDFYTTMPDNGDRGIYNVWSVLRLLSAIRTCLNLSVEVLRFSVRVREGFMLP